MMFSYLLLLLLPFSQATQQPPAVSSNGVPETPEEQKFVAKTLPRICIECCMDIMFVVDRSDAISVPGNDKRVAWDYIKRLMADFGADPLNHRKIRIGAMQMGDSTVISQENLSKADVSGSTHTGIRFPLTSGPFPRELNGRKVGNENISWGNNDVFSSERAWGTAAQVAMDHFKSAPPPYWKTDGKKCECEPANHVRLMIWIVAGGPKPASNDPCLGNMLSELNEAEIQTHIVGLGSAWAGDKDGRKCMFSLGADTKDHIKDAGGPLDNPREVLKPHLFSIDPCNKCSGYLDVVFVVDESGSLCDYEEGNYAELHGVCKKRKEFDLEIKFVSQIVAELGKSWKKHRVAIYPFATHVGDINKRILHLKQTGGKTASHYPADPKKGGGNKTWRQENPKTEAQVQEYLDKMKDTFTEGYTATALAYMRAVSEVEWAPPREDGKPTKKVIVFLTDGGPNPGYYRVDKNGDRMQTCPKSLDKPKYSNKKYCLADYTTFWGNGKALTEKAQVGQMNMAVCTDEGDPSPPLVRDRAVPGENRFEKIIDRSRTWADAAKLLDFTPLFIMVGKRAEKHEKDIECLTTGTNGGVVRVDSFKDLTESEVYKSALLNSACTGAKFGEGTGVFARAAEYEAYQQSELMAKIQEMAPVQSTSDYIWSGALVIGVGFASFLYGKKTRAQYYMPLLSDEVMDADRV